MNTQTLDGRYVDREKLVKLLKELFGMGNFQIKVRDERVFERPILTCLLDRRTLTIISKFPRPGPSLQ